MDPSRSTLEDNNVSSCAFINPEDAIKDLAHLHWQECHVTLIQTLNSVNYDLNLQNVDSSKPKPKSRRRRKVRRLGGVDGINTTGIATGYVGGSQSACSSAVGVGEGESGARKLIPKRKRNVRNNGRFGASV